MPRRQALRQPLPICRGACRSCVGGFRGIGISADADVIRFGVPPRAIVRFHDSAKISMACFYACSIAVLTGNERFEVISQFYERAAFQLVLVPLNVLSFLHANATRVPHAGAQMTPADRTATHRGIASRVQPEEHAGIEPKIVARLEGLVARGPAKRTSEAA